MSKIINTTTTQKNPKIYLFLIVVITILFPFVSFAHEEGSDVTDLGEAEILGPIIAIIVIVFSMIAAKRITKRSNINKVKDEEL
ncbi:hypothetical protein CL654_01970 [bacterium]|nr:hypothetical protein [bacterium]|tara:strand:+ start:27361 stop:27612 length:252 start_codon:yes stop_codon:yes gene_type:complete